MEIIIESYHALPCSLKTFKINGIDAELHDFGDMNDEGSEYAEPYACGDMRFTKHRKIREGVLEKYNITRKEYNEICAQLGSKLCIGECGWCV